MEKSRTEAAGYFGPNSVTWQLYREPAVVIGGVRALLLQIAHPAVAEGVARYSNFKKDALGRGMRTFEAMATIYFGNRRQADATAARLQRIHSGIQGRAPQEAGGASAAFVATDPDLMCWVLATLTDTTLLVFEKITPHGLPADWRERFFEESKTAAAILGIPAENYPENLAAFRDYFSNMLNGSLLGSLPVCREMAQAIIRHRYTPTPLAKLLAAGWLPAPLCERLGVSVARRPQQRLERLLRMADWGYRGLPPGLRYAPAYYQALRRIARAEGAKGPMLGRWYDWLARRAMLPLGLRPARTEPTLGERGR